MAVAPPELETRAERAVRRGELLHALELYELLLAERPDDDRVRHRMDSVRALLQPSELIGRRRSDPDDQQAVAGGALETLSDAEQGEMHASSGRFDQAVACYERALRKAPRNELLRERLEELRRLSPPDSLARHDGLERAERLDPFTPTTVARLREPPAAAPAQTGPTLPKDPIERLKALLARVRGMRRRPSAGA
jgi:tetratricopeptide (TPR) repeat protein